MRPPSSPVAFGPQYLTTALYYNPQGDAQYDTLDAEQVAARLTGHLLSGALPGLGIARLEDVTKMHAGGGSTHILAPVDGDEARSLLTDGMRGAAVKVRDGASDAIPKPPGRQVRRRADRWTTDAEGRSFDAAGVPVTNGGFYLNEEDAPPLFAGPHVPPPADNFTREQIRPGVELLRRIAPEAA